MQSVYTAAEVRQMEQNAVAQGTDLRTLMRRAGTRAAQWILKNCPAGRVLILCGKGNNGGDGYVAARVLAEQGRAVDILRVDGAPVTELAQEAAGLLDGCESVRVLAPDVPVADGYAVIVDAVYGIGFHGALSDRAAAVMDRVNRGRARRVALDLPSGTECDACRADPLTFRADDTLTFICWKPVHLHAPSDGFCGRVTVIDIGTPPSAATPYAELPDGGDISAMLPLRPEESSKGSFGRALCVCGSYGMAGAAALAATGALRSGCGLVQLAVPDTLYPILAGTLWEPVYLPYRPGDTAAVCGALGRADAVLFGCGGGTDDCADRMLAALLARGDGPMVIDADGINLLAAHIDALDAYGAPCVLTPHPGEMARLVGGTVQEIQTARVPTARAFAQAHGVCVVLKGHHTVIAAPDGRVRICCAGNSGMAKGGCGDLLAGLLTGLLAQGMDAHDAATAAVYLHGRAGDLCARRLHPRVMQPSDMAADLGTVFGEMEMDWNDRNDLG